MSADDLKYNGNLLRAMKDNSESFLEELKEIQSDFQRFADQKIKSMNEQILTCLLERGDR